MALEYPNDGAWRKDFLFQPAKYVLPETAEEIRVMIERLLQQEVYSDHERTHPPARLMSDLHALIVSRFCEGRYEDLAVTPIRLGNEGVDFFLTHTDPVARELHQPRSTVTVSVALPLRTKSRHARNPSEVDLYLSPERASPNPAFRELRTVTEPETFQLLSAAADLMIRMIRQKREEGDQNSVTLHFTQRFLDQQFPARY